MEHKNLATPYKVCFGLVELERSHVTFNPTLYNLKQSYNANALLSS